MDRYCVFGNPIGHSKSPLIHRLFAEQTGEALVYDAQLAPLDPFAFARMQEFNNYLASTVHVAHAHRPRASRWADEPASHADMLRKVPQNMAECFGVIERHYLHGPWVLGEPYSVADAYLFTMSGWLQSDGVDVAQFPKVADHRRRMAERPAVQRALA